MNLLLSLVLSMLLAANVMAESHNVSSIDDLKKALADAATNEEPDFVVLAAGTYDCSDLPGWIEYRPEGLPQPPEKFPLTIMGAGVDQTVLTGCTLNISTDRLRNETEGNDTGANVNISNVTFSDSGSSGPFSIFTINANIIVNNIKSIADQSNAGGSDALLVSETGFINLTGSAFSGCSDCYNTSARAVIQAHEGIGSVSGCTFTNNDNQQDGVGLHAFTRIGKLVISGNVFENNNAYGDSGALHVVLAGESSSVSIVKNIFTDNAGERGAGVYVKAIQDGSVSFMENSLTNCNGWCAWFESQCALFGNQGGFFEIKNNRFRHGTEGGLKIDSLGGLGSSSLVNNVFSGMANGAGAFVQMDSIKVINNTFTANREGLEIVLAKNEALAQIYNNIYWDSTNKDIVVNDDQQGDGTGAAVELFNNNFSLMDIEVGDHLTQADNLEVNPRLTVGFHLLPYSPLIDMGTSAPGMPDKDFEGDDRTIDANNDGVSEPDMGADEVAFYDPAPQIIATAPQNGATDVPLDSLIKATFSKRMDVSTINMDSFKIAPIVSGGVTYNPGTRIATYTPIRSKLAPDTVYTVTITSAVKDEDGYPLTSDYVWNFITADPGKPVKALPFIPLLLLDD